MENNSADTAGSERYKFILFISGMSHRSVQAIGNLRKICDQYIAGNYDLEIVDINVDRQRAVEHQIVAVPTLIKIQPYSPKIILGDLTDTDKVLKILDLT